MSLYNFPLPSFVRNLFAGLMLLSAALLTVGCTTDSPPPPPPPLPVSEQEFCQMLRQIECTDAVVMKCFPDPQAWLPVMEDSLMHCLSRATATSCNPSSLPYHPEFTAACLDQWRAVYSDGMLARDELQAGAELRAAVFNKGGSVGASCTASTDCDYGSGLRCVMQKGTGTCQLPVSVAAGGECGSNPAAQCQDGLCGASGICTANLKEGDLCGRDNPSGIPCGNGLHCFTDRTGMYHCLKQGSAGERCVRGYNQCLDGFTCSSVSGSAGNCTLPMLCDWFPLAPFQLVSKMGN